MNIPIILTFTRIFLIPAFILIFYLPFNTNHLIATIIFVLAAFTDWLDGYLARCLNQSTIFGAFLDPVADKLMIISALLLIVANANTLFITIPAIIIIGREITVSALREWMSEIGKRASVTVKRVGKIKTAVQIFAIISLLLHQSNHYNIISITGILLLYLAVALTLWSMIVYLKASWGDLTSSIKK